MNVKPSCATDNGGCSHICKDITDGVECACPAGYELSTDNKTCADIDECAMTGICGQGQCENTEGAYQCNCNEGWAGDACDECAPEFYGADCTACACVYGTCTDTVNGDGSCNCDTGFTSTLCDSLDALRPPPKMRIQLDKGDETRVFNLDRYSVRHNGAIAAKVVHPGQVDNFQVEEALRTYRGYCEEEPDAYITAMVLPSGALRYQVNRGNPKQDWGFIPQEEREQVDPEINYLVIGGAATPRSGVPFGGASFVPGFGGEDDNMRTSYRATVSFFINKAYLDRFGYDDVNTVLRKIESSVARTDAVYLRDLLTEIRVEDVVVRKDESIDWTTSRNELATYFPDSNPNFIHTITEEGGSGLAYVCRMGGEGAPNGISNVAVGKSGVSDDGTFYGVFRHELGHNMGSHHYEGGSPEGPTILSGNSLTRMSSYEVKAIMDCRKTRFGDSSRFQERFGAYTNYAIPPYARLDHNIEADYGGNSISIDVMANDHDTNDNAIALANFDPRSGLGGTVDIELGTGPGGRDQLIYTSPMISSGTISVGRCGPGETLDPNDCQTCRSYFGAATVQCANNADCDGQGSICVGGFCRSVDGCGANTLVNACGELCPSEDVLLWLDSSDTENLENASGQRGNQLSHRDEIATWFDRSGQGNDAIAYTSTRSPILQLSGDLTDNARSTLHFNSDFMEIRSIDVRPETNPAMTSIAVFRALGNGGGKLVWVQRQNGFNKRQQPSKGNPNDETGLVSMTLNHDGNLKSYWRNGLHQESSAGGDGFVEGGAEIGIGAMLYAHRGYEGAYHGDFVLSELMIFKRLLSEDERHQIEFYLAKKWDINFDDDVFWYDIVDTDGMMGRGQVQIELK